ncbi:MAG: hypothetical protein V8T41_08915 [Oscillospiraceae bacterium]
MLERGADAETRRKRSKPSGAGGELTPQAASSSDRAAAGTFSDGKLGTGRGHSAHPLEHCGRLLIRRRESILYDAKPHIGDG